MLKKIKHYFNRIWCAILNRQCCETCDCDIKDIYSPHKDNYDGL